MPPNMKEITFTVN